MAHGEEWVDVSHLDAWLFFESDGRVMGQGPCNDIEGEYEFDGTHVEFADIIVSAVGCDIFLPDGSNLEEAFWAVLWVAEPIEVEFLSEEAMAWDSRPVPKLERWYRNAGA